MDAGDERDDHTHGEQCAQNEMNVGATQLMGIEIEFHYSNM